MNNEDFHTMFELTNVSKKFRELQKESLDGLWIAVSLYFDNELGWNNLEQLIKKTKNAWRAALTELSTQLDEVAEDGSTED